MAHLNDPRVTELNQVLTRAHKAGVTHIINAGVDPHQDREIEKSRNPELRIYKAYGIHPMAVGRQPLAEQLRVLQNRLSEHHVVAIGEIGLDKREGMPDISLQIEALRAQLKLANQMKLPVILHSVKTSALILNEVKIAEGLTHGGLWHSFSGSPETASQVESAGLHLSIGGQITNLKSKKARLSVPRISANRLLIESDSPDHPPKEWPHQFSEPACLPLILEELATLRGETKESLKSQTSSNAMHLFRLR